MRRGSGLGGGQIAASVLFILAAYAIWLIIGIPAEADNEVGRITLAEICSLIESGNAPIFVDVREPGEFAEEHLPGAVHLPIRRMADQARERFLLSDVLIPYCLKDFRGFEGARRLEQLGFRDVRLMQQVGISGWKAAGFPTAGATPDRPDEEMLKKLSEQCRRLK